MTQRRSNACLDCGTSLLGLHSNRLRCAVCAQAKRRRPTHNLTEQQQQQVRELAGTVAQQEVVEQVGASRAAVIRFARDVGISLRKITYPEHLVAQVLAFYAEHGKKKTEEHFPNIRLRSLIEHRTWRHDFVPRQTRFTDDDVRVLARMAGLVPYPLQAKHLARPNANVGSIKSFWTKRMPCSASAMQGLPRHWAKYICDSDVPHIKLPPLSRAGAAYGLTIVLWSDAVLYLRDDVPVFLRQAVEAMARFQQWLYCSDRPQEVIHDIVEWSIDGHRQTHPQHS